MSDGAEWIQGFVDCHRPDAVRILDFPHALSSVAQPGHALYGEGTVAFTQWFTTQRQALRHGDPAEVLAALQRLAMTAKLRQGTAAAATAQTSWSYLAKRRGMLDNYCFVGPCSDRVSSAVKGGYPWMCLRVRTSCRN